MQIMVIPRGVRVVRVHFLERGEGKGGEGKARGKEKGGEEIEEGGVEIEGSERGVTAKDLERGYVVMRRDVKLPRRVWCGRNVSAPTFFSFAFFL